MYAFLPDKKTKKMRCMSFSMSVEQRRGQERSLEKSGKGSCSRAACFSPLLVLPEGMSTGTWHLFRPAYWAIHQGWAFLSWAENSGISIAHSQPQFSLDSLKEKNHVMAWNHGTGSPSQLSNGACPPERALHASFARGDFLESRKGKGGCHRDSAGSAVSITRVKGGQGHNLGVYLQGKGGLEEPVHEAFLFNI